MFGAREFLPIKDVQLGRIISDPNYPGFDFISPDFDPPEVTQETSTNFHEIYRNFRASRYSRFGLPDSPQQDIFCFVRAPAVDTYTLRNPEIWFKRICSHPKFGEALEIALGQHASLFVITGFRIVRAYSVTTEAVATRMGDERNTPHGYSQFSPAKGTRQYGGIRWIEDSRSHESVVEMSFRKMKLKLFGKRTVENVALEGDDRGIYFVGRRPLRLVVLSMDFCTGDQSPELIDWLYIGDQPGDISLDITPTADQLANISADFLQTVDQPDKISVNPGELDDISADLLPIVDQPDGFLVDVAEVARGRVRTPSLVSSGDSSYEVRRVPVIIESNVLDHTTTSSVTLNSATAITYLPVALEVEQLSSSILDIIQPVEIDHSWAIQFATGKTDIIFPIGSRWSVGDTAKGWVEDLAREPVNWWPLSHRRQPLPEHCVWVYWKCVSTASHPRRV